MKNSTLKNTLQKPQIKKMMKSHSNHSNHNKRSNQEGQVIMLAVMIFLTLSLTVVLGIAVPISAQIKNSTSLYQTKKSIVATDVLTDDALYRLNSGRVLPATVVLSMNGGTSSAQIADVTGGKQVIVHGESGTIERYSKSKFIQGVGVAFNYGLQVGNGGFEMSGGPTIYGNVFSNGNVIASGGSTVTGSVIAASANEVDTEIDNYDVSGTPWGTQTVGTVSGAQTIAQSFTVSTTTPVTSLEFFVKKTGVPSNATLKIYNDSAGSVGGTQIGGNGSLSAALITTSYGWTKVYPYTPITLTPNTTYWITIQYAGSNVNYYSFAANNSQFSDGVMKLKNKTGSYYNPSPATQDMSFRVFTGGLGTISGITINANANAGIVNSSTVSGNLYCQSGASNNKVCNMSQPVPSPIGFPVSDANIEEWKNAASVGAIRNSDWNIGGSTATSTNGPMKINGSLTLTNSAILTLNGPLFVTGKITVSGAAKIILPASYATQDERIIAERVELTGGGTITGNGQTGSYMLVVASGADCPSSCYGMTKTITISGGAGSVVLIAPNGTVEFSGGASAKSVVAKKMILSGGSTLTYETGLADVSFNSGPSGAWNIESWKEIEQQ